MCLFIHLRIALHVSISRTQVCAAPEKILAERTPTQVLRYHSVLIKLLGSLIILWSTVSARTNAQEPNATYQQFFSSCKHKYYIK